MPQFLLQQSTQQIMSSEEKVMTPYIVKNNQLQIYNLSHKIVVTKVVSFYMILLKMPLNFSKSHKQPHLSHRLPFCP